MYKLRIKIFLGILAGVWVILTAKLVHLQVIQGQSYRRKAEDAMRRVDILPVMRGKITDRKGRILALDDPCFDLCLHYRFLTADAAWVGRQKRLEIVNVAKSQGVKVLNPGGVKREVKHAKKASS